MADETVVSLIPTLGSKGLFVLKDPFANVLVPKVAYTCQAVRTIRDVISGGEDPFTTYYVPRNISQEKYDLDVKAGVCIVSLQSGVGDWVYVPSTYIASYPDANGVNYVPTVLAFYVGVIPEALDLGPLQDAIGDLIQDTVGISKELQDPRVVVVGQVTMVSQEESVSMEASRKENITVSNTERSRRITAETERDTLAQRVLELEQYIAANLPQPT